MFVDVGQQFRHAGRYVISQPAELPPVQHRPDHTASAPGSTRLGHQLKLEIFRASVLHPNGRLPEPSPQGMPEIAGPEIGRLQDVVRSSVGPPTGDSGTISPHGVASFTPLRWTLGGSHDSPHRQCSAQGRPSACPATPPSKHWALTPSPAPPPQLGLGHLEISDRQIRRWESASPPWPRADHQRLLVHVLQLPIEELGFTPPWDVSVAGPDAPPAAQAPMPRSTSRAPFALAKVRGVIQPSTVAGDYAAITVSYRRLYPQRAAHPPAPPGDRAHSPRRSSAR